jgi:predicted HicB family RNase H-like nuclease
VAQSRPERSPDRKERMLHIRVEAGLHQRLRLIAAGEDTSLQDWITRALEQAVARTKPKTFGRTK